MPAEHNAVPDRSPMVTTSLRVSTQDLCELEALAKLVPSATKAGVAREAIRIGLKRLRADPTILLSGGKRDA